MNLPNYLTIGRIVLVPVFILFYYLDLFYVAMAVFIIAAVTDLLDGKIARKQQIVTNFGKIMDPLADKILTYTAFCLFIGDGLMQAWMLVVILIREFTVSGIRTVAAADGKVIAAIMTGKIKTVLQMVAIPGILLYCAIPTDMVVLLTIIYYISYAVLWASLAMTVYSGGEYIYKNREVFK
ncbi:MAG: CDP-diacylglycerol--glycerol-3-phosphate 3-phosphatidyltransferase [Clostridia bacterium]|nr:CDP-diacylglycerol--glycerol-3-phosphate 3-phosphatidyltransferase [Clostridia bacterium]